MSDNLTALEDWAGSLLAHLSNSERRKLALALAKSLRRSQAERIARQQQPDGSPFVPRKPRGDRPALRDQVGRIKRRAKGGAMFARLRTQRFLGVEGTTEGAAVAFQGAGAIRIARVHQFGLRDQVAKTPGAAEVTYPQRILLGFSDADRRLIAEALAAHLER